MTAKRKRRCQKALWWLANCYLVSGHDGPCKGYVSLGSMSVRKVFAVSWSKSSESELRRARAEWGES